MKLIDKILKWLHINSGSELKVVLTTSMDGGKVTHATVDYLVEGKLVNIRSFTNIDEATDFYKSFTS